MQQRTSSRSSSLVHSPINEYADDSDTISLTSTVEPGDPPDTEFDVEGVHAEREQEIDGQLQPLFLVEWTNFPLDQCTWEPLQNLPEELTNQWEEKKATQDPIVALEFEERYKAAFKAKLDAARQRHRRRNAKRKKLGHPTTSFWFRGYEQLDSENEVGSADEVPDSEAEPCDLSSDGNDEGDEADEDNTVDHKATEALESTKSSSRTKLRKQSRPPSRVFTFDPDDARPTDKRSANAKGSETALPKSPKTSARPSSTKESQKPQLSKRLSRDRGLPTPTRYQGSARKPSTIDSSSDRLAEVGKSRSAAISPSSNRPTNGGVLQAAASATAAVPASNLASVAPAATAPPDVARKTLKGRKTKRLITEDVNIFSGGKKARKRQSVSETELNTSLPPKIYKMHNFRRKAELRARDRNDQAPDISMIANAVFAPGSNAESTQSALQARASKNLSESEGGPVKLAEEPQKQASTMPPTQFSGAVDTTAGSRFAGPPKRSSLSSSVDRPFKKAKKVHFTEVEAGSSESQGLSSSQTRSERFPKADDKWIPIGNEASSIIGDEGLFVSEPMDIDEISNPSPGSPVDKPNSSIIGVKRLSLSTYKSRSGPSVQSVDKKIKISISPDRALDITFNTIPRAASLDPAQQWLHDFLDTVCLDIGHVVLAETLIAQLQSLSSHGFQSLCFGTTTSVANSEDLDIIAEHLRIGSSGLFVARPRFNLLLFPTRCADFEGLNYFGVEPTSPGDVALKYFMFSSSIPIFQHIRPSSTEVQGLKARAGQEKVLFFPTILGIQYSALIASSDKDKTKPYHFFLAFPQRAMEWHHSIASWLSTRERACKIYTNFDSGSWLAFVEKAKRERGVIIVHEALRPFLRRFPQLAKLLLKYPVNIWLFSESLDLEPPQPLVGSSIVPAISTKLFRLFPVGSVVLVTPSFIVSEPQAAYKLFKWFFEVRAKHGNNKLVVAYNITEYLSALSREKIALRSRLENSLWLQHNKGPVEVAMDKTKGALTDQDLEARQKTWLYMDWWLSQQVQSEVPFSELNPAIFADRSIDPHDEQSLVNWFGWWSMEHSHEYRKFYVLGSSSKTESGLIHTLTSRTSRKVPLIQYSRSVVNDPDEAMRIISSTQVPARAGEFGFQSQCFHNDENRIKPWLETQDKGYFAKLYRFPVSWADTRMAAHYGDPRMCFKTIQQWWDSVLPWSVRTHSYNTFISFFYTVSEEWDANNSSEAISPKRHPWLAIYRPVDPHNKSTLYSHGKTELVIWDVRAGAELQQKQPIQLNDLTWMQQALVNHIQLHALEKNPGSFLERVWLGGFQAHQSSFVSTQPADITAEFLMSLIEDLKHSLPGAGHYMAQNGYRLVALSVGMSSMSTYNEEQSCDDPDTRIIFHPPRGSGDLQPMGTSKCINELFEATRLERLRFKSTKEMIYTYPPTLTWYQKQVTEGRHFEHMLVDEWDKVFSVMGVDKSISGMVSTSDDRAV